MKRLLSFAVLALAAACQTYDFEPVQPIAITQTTQSTKVVARRLKPNLMILVDKSGSMNNTIMPGCMGGGCATRVSELKMAMGNFLSTSASVARMGLAFFPREDANFSPAGCRPTAEIDVELPPPAANDMDTMPLVMNATRVSGRIQAMGNSIPVAGGTPTAGSLSFLGGYAGLLDDRDNREDFVLLLTDGLPNCNSANPLGCSSMPPPTQNLCTLGTNPMGASNCIGQYCRAGFLDKDGVVSSVRALKSRNIRTIVVGFGADFASPEALDVLNAMAAEGGFARRCPNGTNAECGDATGTSNRCSSTTPAMNNTCQKQFYAARSANELSQALLDIQNAIGDVDPCIYTLADRPVSERFLAVIINGTTTPSGPATWTLTQQGSVQFTGALCDRVKASTTADPLNVEFRIVNTL
ncbi:MAG: adventurous gliding motility lipoprotein CglB [Myxococcaceae bacterium]|nr:adventurous gliding motility lipoprotein CglB [Myxococcaceae bacterium]